MTSKPLAMRDAFLTRLLGRMDSDPSLFLVTADFGSPVIDAIRSRHGSRFINVGIAEQGLINVSAGLALEGFNVFAYAIAPFITMRCFEQTRVNLCLLSQVRPMSVSLVGVGAGYSYVVSGPTHQCYEDISIMRTLPNVRVLSPSDHVSAGDLFELCHEPGIRYLRLDAQVLPVLAEGHLDGTGLRRLHGEAGRVALVSTGFMSHTAIAVARGLEERGISCTVDDLWDLSRFDQDHLAAHLRDRDVIVSLEEGFTGRGGLDAVMQGLLRERAIASPYLPMGVPPAYGFELGSRAELHREAGLDDESCIRAIVSAVMEKTGATR
ncbi:transketolase C-terminal domain-containing protein [Methylobacterium sp. GC_Met_2]|uniref:transketolase family protein n=1 Tax=Methylobacterium sp. GC_Met_2 TaxID=2937376 RepID=UPI00226B7B79|nr:transketolase C-terminal domain-containing protein [Methylobacterium sp. GC_Met_2]